MASIEPSRQLEMARKRSILQAARFRFSPQTQPVRETAIDKIVEQNMLIADSSDGLTILDMENIPLLCYAGGIPVLSRQDLQASLARLHGRGRILVTKGSPEEAYRLTESALTDLWKVQEATESRFGKAVERLFQNAVQPSHNFLTPLLECLCTVFARLSETYVRLLKGEITREELIRSPNIGSAIQELRIKYSWMDGSLFENAVYRFFAESDPEFDAIKWNLAQNYYVSKALGLDPSGLLLSTEVFGNSLFYLDTNILIQALEPSARHHASFEALSRACRNLDIKLHVCQISLDELGRVVGYQRDLIRRVADQIPNATAPKVRGLFYHIYRRKALEQADVDLDQLFEAFMKPMEILGTSYEVELVDDSWFDRAVKDKTVTSLCEAIRSEFFKKRHRLKPLGSARHDAMLLRWVELQREKTGQKTWLITLDTSLPSLEFISKAEGGRPLAVTLPAFLQWISPITVAEDSEQDMAAIFAEAVKYQILPQESFFDLRDFLVFAEMEMSCKELPSKDVEECIRYVKTNAPNLDPARPSDREKLAHEISKFMADPGRRYKQELRELEGKLAKEREDAVEIVVGQDQKLEEKEVEIKSLRELISQSETRAKADALKLSGVLRSGLVALMVVALEAVILYVAIRFGKGSGRFEKILYSWPIFGLPLPVGIWLFWLVVGRERIRALGWPFTRLLAGG